MRASRVRRRGFLAAAAGLGGSVALGALGCLARRSVPAGDHLGAKLARFRGCLAGTLILPGDHDYEGARRLASFNPRSDKRPSFIVRCGNASDVARSLEFARSSHLEIAVRGGGHDVLGGSVCEGGVLIDLAPLGSIRISPERGVALVQSGARVGAVNEALQGHGLSAALGCHPGVGVAGLTLGGGLGWLLGRFGAACDNLVAVEIVTAEGRQLRASETENAELFWGLRGGGGNFGIATAFEYRLHPVGKVVGGCLAYSGARTRDFLRFYRDYMAQAPDELTVEVVMLSSDEPVVLAVACYSGDAASAVRVLAPLRMFGPLLVNGIREVPYARLADPPPEIARMVGGGVAHEGEDGGHRGFNYWRGASLSTWTDSAIDAFVTCAATAPPGWSMGVGHYMHGAVCRVGDRDTPLLRRVGHSSYHFNVSWGATKRSAGAMAWVDRSLARMAPFSDAPTYVNYLSSDTAQAVAAAYGEGYGRLVALKRQFDPDNVFHRNRNIRPE